MSHYLIVAHQTAASRPLVDCILNVMRQDASAKFTLLVPATPVEHLPRMVQGDARSVARQVAQAGKAALEAAGAEVVRTAVGDASPLLAIDDELRQHPGMYQSAIIATLPAGASRWLRVDLPARAEDKFGLRVIHVTAQPTETPPEAVDVRPGVDGERSTVPLVVNHLIRALAGNQPLPVREARRALVALGPIAVPYVMEATGSSDANIRMGAFKVLAESATPEAAPVLVAALQDTDGGIRWLAAEGLIQAGTGALPELLRSLIQESSSAWLQDGARHVLRGLRGDPDYPADDLEPLHRALSPITSSVSVMSAASEALGRLRQLSIA